MPAPCDASLCDSDLRLAELQTPELFLVTLLRLRAAARPEPGGHDWREGLITIKMRPQGVAAFDRLFRELERGTTLELRNLRHPRVATDEAQLLRVISLLQHRRFAEVELLTADWLPPAVAQRALREAWPFAEQLGEAGLVIPLRRCAAAEIDLIARQLLPARGLLLVH
jgi:hypothetical protein